MNKLFTRIGTAFVGIAMAIGVGVAIGSISQKILPTDASSSVEDYSIEIDFSEKIGDMATSSSDASSSEVTFTVGGYTFGYKKLYYSSSDGGYTFFVKKSSNTSGVLYNKTPIPNLSAVTITCQSSCSSNGGINATFGNSVLNSYIYSDYTEALTVGAGTVSSTASTVGTNQYFNITSSTTTNVRLIKVSISTLKLNSIAAAETSAPATHYIGDVIYNTGLTVTPSYNDSTKNIPVTNGTGVYFNSTYTATSFTLENANNTVPVYYKDAQGRTANTSFNISAESARTVVDVLSVANAPSIVAKDETINPNNVTLNVSYNEGPNGTVTATSVSCDTSNGGIVTATATYSSATGTKTATWNVSVRDGTQTYPYTFEIGYAKIAALSADTGGTNAYIEGIISKITTAYNDQYHNVSFNFSADGEQTGNQINAYRCVATSSNDYIVGDKVVMYGELYNFGGTKPELNAGCTVYVRNTPTSLSITGGKTNYLVGETFAFDGTAKLNWSIDGVDADALDNASLTFSKSGAFTKLEQGNQAITVTYTHTRFGAINGTFNVTVNWTPASSVVLDRGNEVTISANDDITITASVLNVDTAEQYVDWTYESAPKAGNTFVEDVDFEVLDDGMQFLVDSKSNHEGTVTVTATARNGKSASCVVTISAAPVVTLDITSLSGKWTGDAPQQLVADFDNFTDIPEFSWESSNESVATVTPTLGNEDHATVNFVGGGSATITVTATHNTEEASAVCSVTVSQSAIIGITLSHSEENIYTNDPFTLTVTGYTKAGGNETEGVTWETSDNTKATVNNGVVTATAEGDVTITARSTYTTTTTASCLFHITADSMTLSWGNKGTLRFFVGDKVSLNEGATLTASYANPGKDDVALTLGTSGVGAFLKDADGKNETPIDLSTYTFVKGDNGRKLGFSYNDGNLSAKTSGYTIEVVNWRNVFVTVGGTGSYDFSKMVSTSGATPTQGQMDACWGSSDGVDAPTVTASSKIYGMATYFQLGSNGNAGSITLSFEYKVESITIAYTADKATKIEITNCTDVTISSDVSPVTRNLSSASASITIATDNRLKINSIEVSFQETQKNVGKGTDALAVQAFVDGYMHMDDYAGEVGVEGPGYCKDNEHNYYGKNTETGAKYAFNHLTDSQRAMFTTNAAFAAEWARLQAWAAANGDTLNGSSLLAASDSRFVTPLGNNTFGNQSVVIIVTVLSVITLAAIAGCVILKRKER